VKNRTGRDAKVVKNRTVEGKQGYRGRRGREERGEGWKGRRPPRVSCPEF